jgi:5-methyltetrahydropteroyltriglutamate--homocysteine methyltransferase
MFSTNVDGYFMEFDSARAGGFEPLRALLRSGDTHKRIVLGLVTTKLGELESKDDLKRRIDEAAKVVPLDRLCLSPQCGFSSTHHGNALTQDDQWRKLERVVEVATEVWG